ncbi:USP31 [Lepeophtheirus salmonis]|uniref:USP31 n=1 Tax=Lepeophtheirus salmonis TaxID=72036 RepID=A0A7R8CIC3_LEPSM|nr:USP31 [Lepeophtheirus salmonis]CAF2828165.1 USP31 [Lepeophtheirus salmonis]
MKGPKIFELHSDESVPTPVSIVADVTHEHASLLPVILEQHNNHNRAKYSGDSPLHSHRSVDSQTCSILDDDSNLMHYHSGTSKKEIESDTNAKSSNRNDDYEEVDSTTSGEEYNSNTTSSFPRRRSESDLLKSTKISPYCVGPVLGPRSKRFGSTASRISQDSGAFCDEIPPPLPRKPRSEERTCLDASRNPQKKAFNRRRRTLHNFDSNKENSLGTSPPSVSTKKKFKIFGSKTPLSVMGEDSLTSPAPSPRRRKLFRNSLINTSLRKRKQEQATSLLTPLINRRRSSLKFGSSSFSKSSTKNPSHPPSIAEDNSAEGKSEEIIKSSEDEDFSNCIRDAMEHGLPIIPFQSNLKYDTKEGAAPTSKQSLPTTTARKKSLENIVGEAQKEIEDEEKRLLNIMMKHADLLLTPKLIREALKKNKTSRTNAESSESDLSEEEISEYLEMNRLPGRHS